MIFGVNESFAQVFIVIQTKSKSYFNDFLEENIEKSMQSYYRHLPYFTLVSIVFGSFVLIRLPCVNNVNGTLVSIFSKQSFFPFKFILFFIMLSSFSFMFCLC